MTDRANGDDRLMVLCPFMFLLLSPTPPALSLQPTEVASIHWVPLRTLLSPDFRTFETTDVSDRLARQFTGFHGRIIRYGLRLSLGHMFFAAIELQPTTSVFSPFGNDFLGERERLVVWGLTLGVLADFLDMLPPAGGTLDMWVWPTLTAPDVQLVAKVMTSGLRKRNLEAAREAVASGRNDRGSTVHMLLEGYLIEVRKAVWITIAARAAVGTAVIGTVLARWLK